MSDEAKENPTKKRKIEENGDDNKLEQKCINTIRIFSADMVEKANSG